MRAVDLTGKTFGFWTVIKRDGCFKNGDAKWLAKCVCGKIKSVRGRSLLNGTSKGCKCMRIPPAKKHGLYATRIHGIWQTMKARCYNKNTSNFKSYGGRGIKICKEWLESPLNFYN